MSTKIYGGFYLENVSLEGALELVKIFRKEIYTSKASLLMAQIIADIAVSTHDEIALDLIPLSTLKGRSPIQYAQGEFSRRYGDIKKTSGRDPFVDLDIELVFFVNDGKVYGIIFTEQNSLKNEWMSQANVKDFSYWNSEDRPNGISSEEWILRENIWNRIFQETSIPAECGFTVSLKNPPYPSIDCIVEAAGQCDRASNDLTTQLLLKSEVARNPHLVPSMSFVLKLKHNPDFATIKQALSEKLAPGVNLQGLLNIDQISPINMDIENLRGDSKKANYLRASP